MSTLCDLYVFMLGVSEDGLLGFGLILPQQPASPDEMQSHSFLADEHL